jgi:hypothetical protein
VITEVSLDHAGDGRTGEGGEGALCRVVAARGLDQTAAGDLAEIVIVLTAPPEAAGDGVGQPEVIEHEGGVVER